ncbi:MAG TPA: hypothetical protein VHE30_29720, partial [Polyangiaceae bacterium]|nr:hypothetical protein [Polyangiaceae bacterium]
MKHRTTRNFALLAATVGILAAAPRTARAEDVAFSASPSQGTVGGAPSTHPSEYDGPPTLVRGSHRPKLGGYASFGGAYTHMLGRDGGLMSLEAAFLLDHRFSIGFAGYGFTRTPSGPADVDGTPRQFAAGYGGLAVRYSLVSDLPVYATVG